MRDLERLFKAFETFVCGWEIEPHPLRLPLVPAGADAEYGPAFGEHIQRADRFHQIGWLAVNHPADERAERSRLGLASQEIQDAVPLEHRVICGAKTWCNLVVMIHDPQAGEPGRLGCAGDFGQG